MRRFWVWTMFVTALILVIMSCLYRRHIPDAEPVPKTSTTQKAGEQ